MRRFPITISPQQVPSPREISILHCFLFLLLLSPLPLQGQWEFSLKYAYRPEFNTLLYLQAPQEAPADTIPFEVSFRLRGTHRNVFVKNGRIFPQPGQGYMMPLKLPAGDYLVTLEIAGTAYQEMPYTSLGQPQKFEASDLFLSYQPLETFPPSSPLISGMLENTSDVHFFLEVYAPVYSLLTAKAVLYRETPGRGPSTATTFSSQQQISRVLSLSGGKGSFSGSFDLSSLPDGNYLVEILIFDQDQQLGEKSARFSLPWKDRQRVFKHLRTSVEQLRYIAGNGLPDALRGLPDGKALEQGFITFWENLYPGEGEMQMEQYFRKVYEAEKRFEGWDSDRGKIFILYGEPQVDSLSQGEHIIERWRYPEWGMVFRFSQGPEGFQLLD